MSEFTRPQTEGAGEDGHAELSALDVAALEALVEAGFDLDAVSEAQRDRARRVAEVLNLLDVRGAVGDLEAMTDATLARIRMLESVEAGAVGLIADDEDALEALVAAGLESERVPAALRRRASRQESLLSMLEPARSELAGDGTLVARTLARVQESIDKQERRLVVEPARASRRVRVADLVTVAALVAIAGAAVGPMVGAMRAQSRQMACASGLQAAGLGFASYAADFQDRMPMASPSTAGRPWWHVGRPEESNSANFYTLARAGYNRVGDLACAGNQQACRSDLGPEARDWRVLGEVSYSYQNMFGRHEPRLTAGTSGRAVVIAVDASPVVRRAVQGQWINPLANSENHAGRGQNALFSDGHVKWLKTPVLETGDNIWLPRFVEQAIAKFRQQTKAEPIKGTETPAGPDDEFVGP